MTARWVRDPAPISELPAPLNLFAVVGPVVGFVGILVVVAIVVTVLR